MSEVKLKRKYKKLTIAEIAEIRARSTGKRGECKQFAAEYGVSASNISHILTGRTWKA